MKINFFIQFLNFFLVELIHGKLYPIEVKYPLLVSKHEIFFSRVDFKPLDLKRARRHLQVHYGQNPY